MHIPQAEISAFPGAVWEADFPSHAGVKTRQGKNNNMEIYGGK
jgi:hypothetical protein